MNSESNQLALYGLKYNPFLPFVPVENLWCLPGAPAFLLRLKGLIRSGGFGLITGEVGEGKSKLLQWLAYQLEDSSDAVVRVMERPQSGLSDFYRELGDLFDVNLSPANRYGGFKALRERWQEYIKRTLIRPVVLIDEAQEVQTICLNELRLLGSAKFDSEHLMTVILCGDTRLPERFRRRDLMPLGSRMRVRLQLSALSVKELKRYLEHMLENAGAPHLMSPALKETLCEHAAGNLRTLTMMSAEMLTLGMEREDRLLDVDLFLQAYSRAS
jgi:type II secretory pathway predicted ATPase ExeA